jgi:hypothetical protein
MKQRIETIIKREIDSMLGELDIDAEIERLVGKDKLRRLIDEVVHDHIRSKVSEAIEMSIFRAIQKHQPLIDAYTASKVQGLLYKIDDATK